MTDHSTLLTHPKYRKDIDGLRAIAVLSVVIFHSFPDLISGGFVGVDVFFVISGFLISGIIFSNLEHDTFSLREFYIRRIRRIFPALVVVLISTFIVGWFVLLPDEYKNLGKHMVGGAGFVSNYLLWKESGYFDSSAELKPLLHLWSLAIEEQFYVFWPLILYFVWKRKWSFLTITSAIAIVSFSINAYAVTGDKSAAFFLPLPRFWELMVGGLLAYISIHRPHLNSSHKDAQSVLGAALLALGMTLINSGRAFPGWWALLPVLGSFFIISAGPSALFNKTVLSNKVLVWFGLISYPLYLWHWPILSFARIMECETPPIAIRLFSLILSVTLAWLTFRLVETPVRFGKSRGATVSILIILMILVGGTGFFCFRKSGFEGHGNWTTDQDKFMDYFENSLPQWRYYTRLKIREKLKDECNFFDIASLRAGHYSRIPVQHIDNSCYMRNSSYTHAVFIWGDSHAQHLNYGLANEMPRDWQIMQVASSGCEPDASVTQSSTTNWCQQSNWFAIRSIVNAKPDVVIVAQNVDQSLAKMDEIAKALKGMGVRKVLFMGPTPHWTADLPKIRVRKLWQSTLRRTTVGIDTKVMANDNRIETSFINSDSQRYVDIIKLFCNQSGCLTYLGDDVREGITSDDYGHLTPIASDYLAKNLLVSSIVDDFKDGSSH